MNEKQPFVDLHEKQKLVLFALAERKGQGKNKAIRTTINDQCLTDESQWKVDGEMDRHDTKYHVEQLVENGFVKLAGKDESNGGSIPANVYKLTKTGVEFYRENLDAFRRKNGTGTLEALEQQLKRFESNLGDPSDLDFEQGDADNIVEALNRTLTATRKLRDGIRKERDALRQENQQLREQVDELEDRIDRIESYLSRQSK